MRLLTIFVLLAVGCGDEGTVMDGGLDASPNDAGTSDANVGEALSPMELGLAPDPPGAWYAGDLHVHATGASNDTGGDSTPEDIKRVAMERGLYFVVLTDHSNSTGSDVTTTDEDPALFNMGPEFTFWDRAAELSEPGTFLMIDGNEISPVAVGEQPSTPTGHVGCIPADLDTFDRTGAFIDRPRGTVTGGDVLQQALDRGCFAVINHPYGVPWISFDWTGEGYHALEIWNGTTGQDQLDDQGRDAWRCDLLQGKSVTPIAASDNHRVLTELPGLPLHPALGAPRTSVFAAAPDWPAIVDGLRAGDVVLHEGDSWLLLDGYARDGARAEDATTRYVRVRARLSEQAPAPTPVVVSVATACDDLRPAYPDSPVITEQAVFVRTLAPGAELDVAVATAGPGVYTAVLDPPNLHWGAWSRAVVVP